MKNLLLVIGILFTSFSFASGPIDGKVYGKANLSVVSQDDGGSNEWNLNSNASRLGLKGATKISDGLEVGPPLRIAGLVDPSPSTAR